MKNAGKTIFCFLLVLTVAGCGGGGGSSSINIIPARNAVCGDGLLEVAAGEVCDDANIITEVCDYGDMSCEKCDASCHNIITASFCGDGISDTSDGEDCDDRMESVLCNSNCTAAACGDMLVNPTSGEKCDDGNTTDNDGCSSLCKIGFAKTFGGLYKDVGTSIQQTTDGGYIISGYTVGNYWVKKLDSSGQTQWDSILDSTSYDYALKVQQTTDGGYIVVGQVGSGRSSDIWEVKLDSSGSKEWGHNIYNKKFDFARSIIESKDGGYVLIGTTGSNSTSGYDFLVIKLASPGGILWNKEFGGSRNDEGRTIWQTTDGGYIVAGATESYGAGNSDFWIIKLKYYGEKEWDKTYGGAEDDHANSIQQTTDGGYIVAGTTKSYGAGNADSWIIKLDSDGEKEWDKTYGSTEYDYAGSIQQTTDGGYIVAGGTMPYGAGNADLWIIKLDSYGEKEWDKTYGGASDEAGWSVQQTTDKGYIAIGQTMSFGAGDYDMLILKLDPEGNCNGCIFE